MFGVRHQPDDVAGLVGDAGDVAQAAVGVAAAVVGDDASLGLEGDGRVVVRYADVNPNGSYRSIAGITNEAGNVVGLMPHPEHAVDPLTGPSADGLGLFTSVLGAVRA